MKILLVSVSICVLLSIYIIVREPLDGLIFISSGIVVLFILNKIDLYVCNRYFKNKEDV